LKRFPKSVRIPLFAFLKGKISMKRDGISQGLGLIPSGVFVLAATDRNQTSAMLASFVQQAGFDPPTVVAALQPGRPVYSMIERSGTFVINIMGKDSTEALRRFWNGVPPGTDPFEGLDTGSYETGIPVLRDAVGFLECKFMTKLESGDHHLIVGEILNGGRLGASEPMVRIRKNGFEY
jgi:3-hydroxy-9,10-secoandrosta-1,3,5(10)-triene-9,17-dione monooxygenase reductase component